MQLVGECLLNLAKKNKDLSDFAADLVFISPLILKYFYTINMDNF